MWEDLLMCLTKPQAEIIMWIVGSKSFIIKFSQKGGGRNGWWSGVSHRQTITWKSECLYCRFRELAADSFFCIFRAQCRDLCQLRTDTCTGVVCWLEGSKIPGMETAGRRRRRAAVWQEKERRISIWFGFLRQKMVWSIRRRHFASTTKK